MSCYSLFPLRQPTCFLTYVSLIIPLFTQSIKNQLSNRRSTIQMPQALLPIIGSPPMWGWTAHLNPCIYNLLFFYE